MHKISRDLNDKTISTIKSKSQSTVMCSDYKKLNDESSPLGLIWQANTKSGT